MKKPELLSPAGDRQRLDAALQYGADAVYLAADAFGMRTAPANFTLDALRVAVADAHRQGKRVYVTCNTLPRDDELSRLPGYLEAWREMGVDALIVADLGVMALAQRHAPGVALHISTQFGVVNSAAARRLHELGACRVVLARELSLEQIAAIRAKTPPALELEAFVHGAMCMAYSGRCLFSAYLTGRNANRGDCTQPCRWEYQFIEPHRADRPFTGVEEADGTYLFNAHDLNMIEHVGELAHAGVGSFKIEGRAKAAYYVAVTANAYRMAIDGWDAAGQPVEWRPKEWIVRELDTVSHRPYGTGFYFGQPSQNTQSGGYIREWDVVAVATEWRDGIQYLQQRNRFFAGDVLSVLAPGQPPHEVVASPLWDGEGHPINAAPHPTMALSIPLDQPLVSGSLLRKKL
ncbi:MAG: peptidase U32 family protein [Acutalibacteraceae bacterium]